MNAPGRLRTTALAVVVSLLVVLVGSAAAATPRGPAQAAPTTTTTAPDAGEVGDNPQLDAKYQGVLAEEAKLQASLTAAQDQVRAAQLKLVDLQTKTRETQLLLLAAQVTYTKATAVATLKTIAQEQAERRTQKAVAKLREQAASSYVRGGPPSLTEAVLAAQNGDEVGQALTYGKVALGDTDAVLKTLQHARDVQRRAARAAETARRKAAATRRQIAVTTTVLTLARDQQRKLVDLVSLKLLAVNASLKEVQTRRLLAQGEADGAGTGGSIGTLLATLEATQPDYQLGAVDIRPPVPGAKVSSPFGIRLHPILHIYRLHAGCDLGEPTGTPIHAAADGTVVLAQQTGGYGNTTVIDHGNSLATLYGHQSQILVTVGQIVKRGEVIGLIGNTGLSTGPHLHFETRIKGTPVDPEGIVDFAAPFDPKDPYGDGIGGPAH